MESGPAAGGPPSGARRSADGCARALLYELAVDRSEVTTGALLARTELGDDAGFPRAEARSGAIEALRLESSNRASDAPRGDVFLPLPPGRAASRARHWRSTWVISSLQTLKERGYYPRYLGYLPSEHRSAVLLVVAGVWLPMADAVAHYRACDRLGLSRSEQVSMGLAVGERAQGTVLRTAVRMATGAGVTPWTILPQMQRLWDRGADGGGVEVRKVGPKEAVVEVVGCGVLDVPYFRSALGGVIQGIVQLFCRRAYVHDLTDRSSRSSARLRLQWA